MKDLIRLGVLSTLPYAILVAESSPNISVWGTMYALLGYAYCTCAIYCIYVISIGQSVLWSIHARQIIFQCVYAHLGAIIIMYIHLVNKQDALLLTYMIITQSHTFLLLYVQSVRFRCASANNLCLCLSLGTLLIMTWSQYVIGFDILAVLNLEAFFTIFTSRSSVVLLVVPDLLLHCSLFVSGVTAFLDHD